MRPRLPTMAVWAIAVAAAVAGGGVAVAATGAGDGSIEVLTVGEVDAELESNGDSPEADESTQPDEGAADDEDTKSDEGAEPEADNGSEQHSKTTEAGTVTVTCAGDVIAGDAVTPAAGWDIGDTAGGGGPGHKAEVVFTTDDSDEDLIVTYVCQDGEAVWDTRYE